MMSDDDDVDFTSTNQSSKNLASLFHGRETGPTVVASTAAYVPPKQPKKDSSPKVMTASVIQAFIFADQKWTPRGKMGAAILSTDNTLFQLILYKNKTQPEVSTRITTSAVITSQPNNYLSFQDDVGQNWSIMFDNKQALIDFTLQVLLAKAYLLSFKFDHIIQQISEGEGSALVDNDSAEVTVVQYKLLENGTLSSADAGDNKPVRYKIGKQQHGKAFDECLRGMKKNGQRLVMIGTSLYNIEVTRIKREKEARTGSITLSVEEPPPLPPTINERKRTITEDNDGNNEKNKLLQRINRMGGVSMLPNQNQSSAFVTPLPPQTSTFSDDDSIHNEFIQNVTPAPIVPVQAAMPPVQYVPPTYHHMHHPPHQSLIQQPNLYTPQQPLHDYNSRPGSSMGMGAMGYQQSPMWHHSQYPQTTPNVPPPTDMFYQQQMPNDFRQLFTRLNEKVDTLNEKFDTKNSTSYPNMETSILLANIQRIVKENETMKKDLFDRSAKVEEQNLKISELLDRNQKLIEQSHQTVEQRNVVVNNVSEQTAQKILDLEKQKVELTNNLSVATSKIADLQLQLNQHNQGVNENQSKLSSLLHRCEQYKEELEKSQNQYSETQTMLNAAQEQLKAEKAAKKQLQSNLNILEEELTEVKATCASLEKVNNERKLKAENERKRWQDDMDEQKQSYEKELDELRNKLRKQRTADSATTSQEIGRIEEELVRQWQEKLDRQQAHSERLLSTKGKELEQLQELYNENENKLQEVNEELNASKQQLEAYQERYEKLKERLVSMREEITELTEEQQESINQQVKRAASMIYQRLKTRIRPTKQYNGEEFLSRTLEIIKKATLKVLSNDENDEQSSENVQSEEEEEQQQQQQQQEQQKEEVHVNQSEEKNDDDDPVNGNSVDQQTLNEELLSVSTNPNEETQSTEHETTSGNNQKNGWDTVDDLQHEAKEQSETMEQSQLVLVADNTTPSVNEGESGSEDSTVENNEPIEPPKLVEEPKRDSDGAIEENEKLPPPELEIPAEKPTTGDEDDDDDDDALFQSARPSVQSVTAPPTASQSSVSPRYTFNENIPLMTNPDDSDDELFK
ncbi:unnamed protein product [Adineta ricciae]|uniref:FK506-binding protein 15 n=1 Tax=Adineta ricciae TaxID=249248 RepID=A0A815VLU1_ADIRI|nr:unnamed protein product [Adineta ricciae]